MPDNPPIIAGTRIGHVHLKVADLDRALGFYCGVLGFEVMQRMGSGAAFISAGGYHHHIGLNTWESKGGHPPPPGTTGLFHTAILYPTRPALADALHRVIAGRHPARRRQRPRRQRSALLARSRRERRRTVSRPAEGRMAAHGRRIAGDVHEAAGSRGFAAAAGSAKSSRHRHCERSELATKPCPLPSLCDDDRFAALPRNDGRCAAPAHHDQHRRRSVRAPMQP